MNAAVRPAPPKIRASFRPPPDKSVTHRALLLAALAPGVSAIKNPLFSEDTRATLACLRALGARISPKPGRVEVRGGRLRAPGRPLDAGESGALMRFLTGALAGAGFRCEIRARGTLKRRPMARAAAPLRLMGARISLGPGGRPPVKISPARLKGVSYRSPLASAQVKTAVLLAALSAEGRTVYSEPSPSRDHTEKLLKLAGARIKRRGLSLEIRPGALRPFAVEVPGDVSSAAPFIAAAVLHPDCVLKVRGVEGNPTRLGFVKTLREMGARIRAGKDFIEARSSRLKAADTPAARAASMIDELPLLALCAARAEGRTRIRGAADLRAKESDRVESTLALLRALGARASFRAGELTVEGGAAFAGGTALDSFGDHRIAMAAAAAGAVSARPVKIKNAGCVNKSYPAFFRDFRKIFG